MKKSLFTLALGIYAFATFAQKSDTTIYNFGLGFEPTKLDPASFTKLKVNVGGDFVLRYQSLHSYASSVQMAPLGSNIDFPAANLNLGSDLAPGIKVNMFVYLASRHHSNTYVEGGYLLMDQLPFLHSDLADKIMKYVTIKVGMMEMNYGDAHFRRTDNARALNNPFIGNYILDGFAIPPALEIYFRHKGLLVMGGLTDVVTDPNVGQYIPASAAGASPSYPTSYLTWNLGKELQYYFKLSYDKKFSKNLRIRPTLSGYICPSTHGGALYGSDRGGSPYNEVMNLKSLAASAYDVTANVTNGYFGPGTYTKDHSYMANLLAQFYGFEFFGTYEIANGNTGLTQTYNVVPFTMRNASAEGLYYFGKHRQYDLGVRYTVVNKDAQSAITGLDASNKSYTLPAVSAMQTGRLQVVAGWRLTNNIMTKVEYCKQTYSNFAQYGTGTPFFEGVMVEAAISF